MTASRAGALAAPLLAAAGAGALATPLVAVGPGAAAAQVAGNAAAPAATPSAEPLPVPPPPVIALPTTQPTASPTARPTAAASPRASASPRATTTPRPTAPPSSSATSTAATPVAGTSPAPPSPTPAASPTAAPVITAPPIAGTDAVDHYWVAALVAAVLAVAALAWVVLRRRRADPAEVEAAYEDGRLEEVAVTDEPPSVAPEPAPAAPSGPSFLDRSAPSPRARLTLVFRPVRAGLNLLSATSENEVTIANEGDAPAEDVRLQLRLVSAHAGLDDELAAIAAEPIGRPAVPPFALAPGERRVVSAVGALPREALQTLTAAGRPMYVPVVALALAWRGDDGEHGLAQAFAVGVERVDSAKLAPFWLDVPARSYDQVAARPHGPVRER